MSSRNSPDTQAGKKSLSAAQRVYVLLRQRIVEMALLPGERIVEKDIAQEFGTSRTPVHEAVQRLAEDGLIEVRPRVGTFVAQIPLDTIEEAMFVRRSLELSIVAKAAERITPEGANKLHAILDAQAECVSRNDIVGFHATDEEFHAALAELSGYPGVWHTILQAKTQIDRFRRLTLSVEGHMGEVVSEHRDIATAIASGNPANAIASMQTHLNDVIPVLEFVRKLRPEYFTAHLGA